MSRESNKVLKLHGKTLVTAEQLCETTGYSLTHVRRAARLQLIPGRKVGKRWWFDPDSTIEALTKLETVVPKPSETETVNAILGDL